MEELERKKKEFARLEELIKQGERERELASRTLVKQEPKEGAKSEPDQKTINFQLQLAEKDREIERLKHAQALEALKQENEVNLLKNNLEKENEANLLRKELELAHKTAELEKQRAEHESRRAELEKQRADQGIQSAEQSYQNSLANFANWTLQSNQKHLEAMFQGQQLQLDYHAKDKAEERQAEKLRLEKAAERERLQIESGKAGTTEYNQLLDKTLDRFSEEDQKFIEYNAGRDQALVQINQSHHRLVDNTIQRYVDAGGRISQRSNDHGLNLEKMHLDHDAKRIEAHSQAHQQVIGVEGGLVQAGDRAHERIAIFGDTLRRQLLDQEGNRLQWVDRAGTRHAQLLDLMSQRGGDFLTQSYQYQLTISAQHTALNGQYLGDTLQSLIQNFGSNSLHLQQACAMLVQNLKPSMNEDQIRRQEQLTVPPR